MAFSTAYLALVALAFALLHSEGDRWWFVTTSLLFGPRWLLAVPAIALIPACAWKRRQALWIGLPTVVILFLGVLDFNVPWRRFAGGSSPEVGTSHLRVLSCNVHHNSLDPVAFSALITEKSPDVVVLQEWTSRDESAFALMADWNFRRDGEFLVATKLPITSGEIVRFPGILPEEIAACYLLELDGQTVRLYNVHLKSPHHAFEALLSLRDSARDMIDTNSRERDLQSWALSAAANKSQEPVVLAGDFNTPSESAIYRRHWSTFTDAFSAGGFGFGNTYFTRPTGMRIDHILSGAELKCRFCEVGPDVGSAHHPVIAELSLAK